MPAYKYRPPVTPIPVTIRKYDSGAQLEVITDQITDQDTPYCDELSYAVCNKIRVLAQIHCLSREYNPSPGHH